MTETAQQEQKQQLRSLLKQKRAALSAASRQSAAAIITDRILPLPAVQQARSIFIFISYGNEVNTHGLLKHFLEQGKRLAVPKILPEKTMIAVPFSAWEELVPGELGILTPRSSQADNGHFDVVITPGLGFTPAGYRIGYGRGYYDKWFASHSSGCRIAVCFDAQIVEDLPVDATDVPVDMIVTEKRVISVREP